METIGARESVKKGREREGNLAQTVNSQSMEKGSSCCLSCVTECRRRKESGCEMRDAVVEKTDLITPRNENSGNPPFDAKVRFRFYGRAVLSGDGCGKFGGAVTAA